MPGWFAAWERALSRFREDSELVALNRRAGAGPTPVSATLWAVIGSSLEAARLSGGLVTPTLLDALKRAGYDRDFAAMEREVTALPLGAIRLQGADDWRLVHLDAYRRAVALPRGVRLDLGPTAFELHQHASLLGLAFTLFHAFILLGERYINATLAQLLIPFAHSGFAPLWVGLGELGLSGMALVGLSFYVRDRMCRRLWRLVHMLSFALALAHGIMSGCDSDAGWARAAYWASGGSVLFLTLYRVLAARSSIADPGRLHRPSTLTACTEDGAHLARTGRAKPPGAQP